MSDAQYVCHITQVNAKHSNKTALHCAAAAGKASVVKLLLDYQADIHAQVIH